MAEQKHKIESRFVTLQEWAALMFSTAPHKNTLLRWVNDGHIHPPPQKVGRKWQVKRDARYVS